MPYPMKASCDHPENAMPWDDMLAIQQVANTRNEVITFRSTGPWSKRWIEAGYPTKGFHVKGKSSDWGPQAGLVPWEGRFSKVSPNAAAIKKGNDYNQEGVHDNFAKAIPLVLNWGDLVKQHTVPAGRDSRIAVAGMTKIDGTDDYMLHAIRPNDGALIPFKAVARGAGEFAIICYADHAPFDVKSVEGWPSAPLLVMASTEGGTTKPMTGDYDLFNICPSWESYGRALDKTVTFGGTAFGSNKVVGLTFDAGHGLDRVMDTRLHTGTASLTGRPHNPMVDYEHRRQAYIKRYQELPFGSAAHNKLKVQLQHLGIVDPLGQVVHVDLKKMEWNEHRDMGNLTPRILQCILDLNVAMSAKKPEAMGLTRRVHHNAESHRNRLLGGLKEDELEKGDGLPITIFQPTLMKGIPASDATGYAIIDTIETWQEFGRYANRLSAAGYYVPQAWHWG